MAANNSKEKVALSFFGFIKFEAEGKSGLIAFLAVCTLLFASRWMGLI